MDSDEDPDEVSVTADLGPHLRTWRVFLSKLRWAVVVATIVLGLLLAFRAHG